MSHASTAGRCLELVLSCLSDKGASTAMCLQATVDLLDQVPAAAADAELCTELARICLLANYPVLAKDAIAVLSRTDSRLSTAQYTSLITGIPPDAAALLLTDAHAPTWTESDNVTAAKLHSASRPYDAPFLAQLASHQALPRGHTFS